MSNSLDTMLERVERVEGLIFMYAAGGGTGSGKTSNTSTILNEDFKGCGFNNYLMDSYRQDYDLGK